MSSSKSVSSMMPMILSALMVAAAAAAEQKPLPRAIQTEPPIRSPMSMSAPPASMMGTGGAVSLAGLSKEQFRALSANALVAFNGQSMTKANFMRMKADEWRAAAANTALPAVQRNTAEAAAKSSADLSVQHARLQAEFDATQANAGQLLQSPDYAQLSREAAELLTRYHAASAEEQVRIRSRAKEVYDRMVQMEHSAGPAR